MNLLDTHSIIWLLISPENLSRRAREAILKVRSAGETIFYSPVSLYEIAYSARRKRLTLNTSTEEFIAAVQNRLNLKPLTDRIAVCAAELPSSFDGDPMDRIITATAIVEDCILITHNEKIQKANVCKILW